VNIMPQWARRQADKRERLTGVASYVDGKEIDPSRLHEALEGVLRSGDRVALDGDNQLGPSALSASTFALGCVRHTNVDH
jgi:malonate decarboxylase alpha subunit